MIDTIELDLLRPHEQYVEGRVAELVHHFEIRGAVDYAIVADAKTGTIIDGHHRYEALRRMGATHAPVLLVDYDNDEITVMTWREDEVAPTKAEIIARAKSGDLYVPKSTRHDFVNLLDPIDMPLAKLGIKG